MGRADARWREEIEAGRVAVCVPVLLEILYSARSRAQYRALATDLAGLPLLETTQTTHTLALRTQAALAERSQHRGPTPTDLVVAAIAEAHDVTLLHYDRHYDVIARVTGQPTRWLARRGSLS
jgi:predicted nucleic acid-binding protein